MDGWANRLPGPATLLRIGLGFFVLAWIFGPYELRAAVPIWLPFAIAAGLEIHFFAGAFRAAPPARLDRGPQAIDRELYGYPPPGDEDAGDELPGDEEPDGEEREHEAAEAEPDEEIWDGDDDWDAEEGWLEEEPPRDRLRPLRRLVTGLAVIGALGLVVWVVEARSGWNGVPADARAAAEERFSQEASRIAEKPVTVVCDEAGEHVGVVQHADGAAIVGGDTAWLTPERCHDLYRVAFKGEVRSGQTGRAIAVLAHEAWHLRGVRDEGTTECYALQSGVELGLRLGLSSQTARRLMRQQLAENARRGPSSFEYRVPAECRPGGALDLDPDDSRFP